MVLQVAGMDHFLESRRQTRYMPLEKMALGNEVRIPAAKCTLNGRREAWCFLVNTSIHLLIHIFFLMFCF